MTTRAFPAARAELLVAWARLVPWLSEQDAAAEIEALAGEMREAVGRGGERLGLVGAVERGTAVP